jgi:hypothetical protein
VLTLRRHPQHTRRARVLITAFLLLLATAVLGGMGVEGVTAETSDNAVLAVIGAFPARLVACSAALRQCPASQD